MQTVFANLISEPPAGLLAVSEFWIFVIIVAISAIANWLKKRSEEQHETDWTEVEAPPRHVSPPPPSHRPAPPLHQPPSQPQPRPTLTHWEEELRRLLEPEERPARPTPPPPVIVRERETAPPPQRRHEPRPPAVPSAQRPRVVVKTVKPAAVAATPIVQTVSEENRLLAEQLRHARTSTRRDRGAFSTEIAQTRALFRDPRTVRQAVIASIVLGQPRALEGERVF